MIPVIAGIIETGDKILIARRKVGKSMAGLWEFPGGKLENGETPSQCLHRELKEEFGIETQILDFVGETIFQYPTFIIHLQAYRVAHLSGEFILSDHDAIEWKNAESIDRNTLAPADIPILEFYLSSPHRIRADRN